MQLFNLINGWAGRSDILDTVLRLLYITAVPLLATALAAVLILLPRPAGAPPRRRVAFAAFIAVVLCGFTMALIDGLITTLGVGTLSPRPFLTHWVNALIVEPNDNSFPCAEVVIAASLCLMLAAVRPRSLPWTALFVLLFAFTRVFCGTNYPEDVLAGAALGVAYGAFALALCRVPLRLSASADTGLVVRPRHQAAWSAGLVSAMVLAAGVVLVRNPRTGPKLRHMLQPKATAAPLTAQPRSAAPVKPAPSLHEGMHEGETAAPAQAVNAIIAGKAEADGHVPAAEAYLAGELTKLNLRHRLVSVDVAEIDPLRSPFRCAAVRFEVQATGTDERKRVVETAAAIAKRSFQVDSLLQNIDVVGVVVNGKQVTGPRLVFTPGIIPVFTASVQRRNLVVTGAGAWTNYPTIDGGSWLNARSLLYFNPRVLPPAPGHHIATPTFIPNDGVGAPVATPMSPVATPVPSPTVPAPSLSPSAPPTVMATQAISPTPTHGVSPVPSVAPTIATGPTLKGTRP